MPPVMDLAFSKPYPQSRRLHPDSGCRDGSFVFNGTTIPVAFKATCSRRAQLWNRQASIIMDLTTLALRHGWHSLPLV
jgi:hypothetical protein